MLFRSACEIRVWAFFNAVNPDMAQYWNYAKGKIERDGKGYATNRMPLWVKPNRKVDVLEVMILCVITSKAPNWI